MMWAELGVKLCCCPGIPGLPLLSLASKESAHNAGDLGLIPGLGSSLEKGKATHSSILAWRIHSMDCIVHGVARVGHD